MSTGSFSIFKAALDSRQSATTAVQLHSNGPAATPTPAVAGVTVTGTNPVAAGDTVTIAGVAYVYRGTIRDIGGNPWPDKRDAVWVAAGGHQGRAQFAPDYRRENQPPAANPAFIITSAALGATDVFIAAKATVSPPISDRIFTDISTDSWTIA